MVACLMGLSLTNCNDFLDYNPTAVIDEDKAFSEPEKMVNAAYAMLGDCWFSYPFNLFPYGDITSDDCLKGGSGTTDTGYHPFEIWSTLTATTPGEMDELWYRLYCAVSRCNRALVSLERNGVAKLGSIILQQTRVAQGYDYFLRFIKRFPDVRTLAAAEEDEVMKYWQGLGYYSRARNLHAAAKSMNGVFPETYPEVLALKGVGEYTAAAICSFAYGMPYAVVDGNVYRVLSRYFGIDTPIDSTEGKKLFAALADEMLDKKHPAVYNQGIMDFGAIQCTPQSPD